MYICSRSNNVAYDGRIFDFVHIEIIYYMGIYIGCVFENGFHNRNDREASKAFLLETIYILKEHYKFNEDSFRIEMDEENDYYAIETDSLEEISSIALCDGIWSVGMSQKYELMFFSDYHYLDQLKEVAEVLGAKEMWICDDNQLWRCDFYIYDKSLSEWMDYLRQKGMESIKEFPCKEELSSYEQGWASHNHYDVVYHVAITSRT